MKLKGKALESTIAKKFSTILYKANNSELSKITITSVKLSESTLKVYFMTFDDEEKSKEELYSSLPYIKRSLAKDLPLKHFPKIEFIYDNSYNYGKKIDDKIKEINEK